MTGFQLSDKTVLFLDLDDTIIKTISGETLAKDVTDFQIRKDFLDKVRVSMPNLQIVCIVSNQGGIPRYYSEHDFRAKLAAVRTFMEYYLNDDPDDIIIDVFSYYCASKDNTNPMRKPNPGMLEKFCAEELEYAAPFIKDKANMLMIGDASGKEGDFADSDKKCAENFGIDYLDVDDFLMA